MTLKSIIESVERRGKKQEADAEAKVTEAPSKAPPVSADDKELQKIYDDCKAGKLLCGEDKKQCCELMTKFLKDFEKNVKKAKKQVKDLKFIK